MNFSGGGLLQRLERGVDLEHFCNHDDALSCVGAAAHAVQATELVVSQTVGAEIKVC